MVSQAATAELESCHFREATRGTGHQWLCPNPLASDSIGSSGLYYWQHIDYAQYTYQCWCLTPRLIDLVYRIERKAALPEWLQYVFNLDAAADLVVCPSVTYRCILVRLSERNNRWGSGVQNAAIRISEFSLQR